MVVIILLSDSPALRFATIGILESSSIPPFIIPRQLIINNKNGILFCLLVLLQRRAHCSVGSCLPGSRSNDFDKGLFSDGIRRSILCYRPGPVGSFHGIAGIFSQQKAEMLGPQPRMPEHHFRDSIGTRWRP